MGQAAQSLIKAEVDLVDERLRNSELVAVIKGRINKSWSNNFGSVYTLCDLAIWPK